MLLCRRALHQLNHRACLRWNTGQSSRSRRRPHQLRLIGFATSTELAVTVVRAAAIATRKPSMHELAAYKPTPHDFTSEHTLCIQCLLCCNSCKFPSVVLAATLRMLCPYCQACAPETPAAARVNQSCTRKQTRLFTSRANASDDASDVGQPCRACCATDCAATEVLRRTTAARSSAHTVHDASCRPK